MVQEPAKGEAYRETARAPLFRRLAYCREPEHQDVSISKARNGALRACRRRHKSRVRRPHRRLVSPRLAPETLTLPTSSLTPQESIRAASTQFPAFKASANRRVRPTVSNLRFRGLASLASRRAAEGPGGARSRRVTQTLSLQVHGFLLAPRGENRKTCPRFTQITATDGDKEGRVGGRDACGSDRVPDVTGERQATGNRVRC